MKDDARFSGHPLTMYLPQRRFPESIYETQQAFPVQQVLLRLIALRPYLCLAMLYDQIESQKYLSEPGIARVERVRAALALDHSL